LDIDVSVTMNVEWINKVRSGLDR